MHPDLPYPFEHTWWVHPGQILAGPYPGTPDSDATRRRLGALLDTGVRCIVNLQQKDETGRGGMPFPDYTATVDQLGQQRGVTVACHRYAIPDAGIPGAALMREILATMQAAVERGDVVYLHCWGGHGRTATVAGCWYREVGLSGQESLDRIAAARRHDQYLHRASPETDDQCRFVREWQPVLEMEPSQRTGPAAGHGRAWPLTSSSQRDRYLGCLLGLAAGDALGTTLEFRRPGTFEPIDDILGGGPFDLQPGQWTDDTSMALCLAESLIERQTFDPVDQLERYVRWWREGHLSSTGECFDIGGTTSEALSTFMRSGEPFCGPDHDRSAGNGSIMRLAPVPMFFANEPREAVRLSGESSRTTHQHPAAVDACRYFGGLLVASLRGTPRDVLLSAAYCPAEGGWHDQPLVAEVAAVANGSFKAKDPPAIRGSGYAVHSLEAALWAFHRSDNFRDGALLAVNLGDDADTTGAVYGQLAGAHYGASGIPPQWRATLAMRDTIEELAIGLHDRGAEVS